MATPSLPVLTAAPSTAVTPADHRLSRLILLIALPLFCALSLALKENYPFSHYPMYGDPSAERGYYFLADGAGKPLPVETLTGKSAAKLGKMIRQRGDDYAKKHGKGGYLKLPKEDMDNVYREVLGYLRQQAQVHKKTLPEKLQIRHTEIRFVNGKVEEKPEVYFAE